ncbi:MAG: MFS transporter [Myxococcota bacterium]
MTPERQQVVRLAVARATSTAGGSAAYVALSYTLYAETGSARWVGAALLANGLATVLASPLAGALGDRLDRRAVMIGSDLLSAAVFVAMASTSSPLALVVLFGLSAVTEAPFEPAAGAAVPNLVPEADRGWANGVVASARSVGWLSGPVVGGLAVAALGPASALLAHALSFGVSAAILATFRQPFQAEREGPGGGAWDGLRVAFADRAIGAVVLCAAATTLGWGLVNLAGAPLAAELGVGPQGFGALETALGLGGLLGAMQAGRALRSGERTALVGGVTLGSVGLGFAVLFPSFIGVAAGFVVGSAARAIADVAVQHTLQARTTDEVRARVLGASEAVTHVAFAAAFALGGPLVDAAGGRATLGVAAILALAGLLPLAIEHGRRPRT